nr:hypothetical protein [Tanacetum cinerariifolium]
MTARIVDTGTWEVGVRVLVLFRWSVVHGRGCEGFEDPDYPDKVYKVVKALYGLHQAPRAWITSKAEARWIFISQDKYVAKILRMFGLTDGKSASTPIDTEKPLHKDLDGKDVDVHTYRNEALAIPGQTATVCIMVNPTIYVSCIKQFWSSVSLKKTNDVVRLQALIDRRKVIITENTVRQALRLDDADVHDDVADVVVDADVKLTPPSPTPATTPPTQQELIPSSLQVESTPPPLQYQSPIAQPLSLHHNNYLPMMLQYLWISLINWGIAEIDADEDVTLEKVEIDAEKDVKVQGRFLESQVQVKNKREKDKIGTKSDQIKKKGEAWRSREKSRAVSVNKGRKTKENAKRMVENARTVKKLLKSKERKKRQGPDL